MSVETEDHTSGTIQAPAGRLATLRRPWTWPLPRLGLIAYLVVLATYIVNVGVPIDRIGQSVWILAGIVAARLGRPVRDHVRAVLDWLPLLAALILYDHTRGIADTLGIPVRVVELADVERLLFGGVLPTAWMQEQLTIRSNRTGGMPLRRWYTSPTSCCPGPWPRSSTSGPEPCG